MTPQQRATRGPVVTETANIPLSELTTRQLVFHLLDRTETLMADLNQSVADLQAAVDAVGARFTGLIDPLKQSLSDAQSALADLQVQDDADKQALQDALDNASAQADSIEGQVSELNDIGSEPAPEPAPEPEPEPTPEPDTNA